MNGPSPPTAMKQNLLCSLRMAWLATAAAAALLAACATVPPPDAALAAGMAAVESARGAGAGELAPIEMNNASGKLESARALARDGKNREAARMAEQAEADASVARAMAVAERSRRAAAEAESSLATLRQQPSRPQP